VFLDQEKACDRINWSYLHRCMSAFGFGPRWQGWIWCIYRSLYLSYMVNDFASAPVRIAQGLRQGDPLSPLLYNIVLEPRLAFLQIHLTGLAFPSSSLKSLAYANDMLVAVGNQEDVGVLETGLWLHSWASSARINQHKSEVMRLNEADLSLPFKMMRPGQSVRYLGIYFKDGAIDACLQYETLIGTMKQRIDS
jgi:hypothetical protein